MSSHKQSVILIFLFSLSALNLSYIFWCWRQSPIIRYNEIIRNRQKGYSYRAHDYPENLPIGDLPSVLMVDEESVHYQPLGYASDAEWFSLASLDAGSGYLRLGPDDRIFAVSMFHQMHCLRMLNAAFDKAPIATPAHLQHCLNYLRQGALCQADLSLEPGDFVLRDFARERSGAMHMCKDWSKVYPLMERNFAWWEKKTGRVHNKSEDSLSPI